MADLLPIVVAIACELLPAPQKLFFARYMRIENKRTKEEEKTKDFRKVKFKTR